MNYKEFYKLPLKLDEPPYKRYAWGSDGEMALMFDRELNRGYCQYIIDVINGEIKVKGQVHGLTLDGVDFYKDGEFIFCVRGHGSLIGIGGHDLSTEKANKIEDDFAKYILTELINE